MRLQPILLVALLAFPLAAVHASTITYSEDLYGSLQGAVDAAKPGDVIKIPAGLYEGPITVDKPLTIMGAGEATSLVITNGSTILSIKSDHVRVNGVLFLFSNAAISVEGVSGSTVEDCFFVENAVGVDIVGGAGHEIRGNQFINCIACGASLQGVAGASIEDNVFNFTQPDDWSDIQRLLDSIPGPGRIGLKLLGSGNLTVSGNAFHNVDRGIYMGNSMRSTVKGNSFHNSTVGLSMRDSTLNNVEDNEGHETGELLFLWLSPGNNMTGNANRGGILSRDVESNNLYRLPGVELTGRNFILETSEPAMDPIFEPLSEALNITLLPDPVTDAAWARLKVNSTELHGDAIPGSLGLYTPGGQLLVQAETVNHRTLFEYEVEGGAQLVLAKKVDSEGPVAVAGLDLTCGVDEEVSLDASGSSDNIGIVGYTWSLGDGLEVAGMRVAHRYDHPGVYTVVLRVVDAAGNIGEDSILVTVTPVAEEEAQGLDLRLLLAPLLVVLLVAGFYFFRARGDQQIT